MTRDEILAMKPGRELDMLVIRHIMNIPVVESVDLFSQEPFPAAWWVEDEGWYIADERDEDGLIYRPYNPSEDISVALEVAERFKDIQITRYVDPEMKMWKCEIQNFGVRYFALEKTMAAAICKAALLAVMDGEDEHERD